MICFSRRHTRISATSSKVLALISLIPYVGKITFRASEWTATSTKKPQYGSKPRQDSVGAYIWASMYYARVKSFCVLGMCE